MSKTSPAPDTFLPLSTAFFHVLLALADSERHGYAIMEHVTQTTDGQVKMGPGTLYGTIKRLLQIELIEESDDRPDPDMDDERRRYYRLTDLGLRVMKAEARRYERLVKAARATGLLGRPQST
jgi:DNA-binding PadR family transcriptional regulator